MRQYPSTKRVTYLEKNLLTLLPSSHDLVQTTARIDRNALYDPAFPSAFREVDFTEWMTQFGHCRWRDEDGQVGINAHEGRIDRSVRHVIENPWAEIVSPERVHVLSGS